MVFLIRHTRRRMVGSTNHMKHFLLSYSTEERKDKYYDKREKLGTLLDDGFGDEASFARFSQNVMAKRESTNRVEWTSNDNLLTVFYDGGCSLCTKEINHYIRLQNKHRGKHREHHLVDFYNIYAEPLHPELERRQISYLDTQKRMHVLTDDGEIIHGFAAFLEIWKRMKYWEYLYLFTKIWPIPIIGEKIYTYWAKRRYDYRKHDIDKNSKCAL